MDASADPTAVICHDAGAANIVIEALRAAPPGRRFIVFMQGPALGIWQRDPVPGAVVADNLEEALATARFIVTGTGWASSLEHDARVLALLRGIPQAAVIDHWVNYRERFERGGITVLPGELWVTDAYAAAEAHKVFPGHDVRRIPNFYLRRTVEGIASPPVAPRVLYLLEPLRYPWQGLSQPGEFEALDFFVRNLATLGLQGAPLRLRAHPSDPAGKYNTWIHQHAPPGTCMDTSPSLSAALSWASWAAGCETMALAVALEAGRRVVSTLPPAAPPCRLPHEGILHLRGMPGAT
ncbi:MAG: hypothetical protein IV104_08865 [Acidovorax sp.]|nr:hypothetical protein [Acidovorax sp.]